MSHRLIRTAHRGFSLAEVLAGLAASVVLVAVAVPAIGSGQADPPEASVRSLVQTTKDSTFLIQIHRAMIAFASNADGRMPRPGLIDQLPVDGREIPGRGPEDIAANTTANLYSAMIIQNYFTPEMVVSPVERNSTVSECKPYDYAAYSPADDQYWDESFTADLATDSNASYAHLVLSGRRVDRYWNDGMLETAAILGNRGPAEGARNGASFTTDPHGFWSGHLVFGDNHIELVRDPAPSDAITLPREAEAPAVRDNVFAMETGPTGADLVLAFTEAMTEDGPARQYD